MNEPFQILEQINRCRYCGSDMTDAVSSQSYLENPFCNGCLQERLEKGAAQRGPGEFMYRDRWARFVTPAEREQAISDGWKPANK